MLKIYRRHIDTCKHRAKGAKYTKCGCPIWVDGMHQGKRSRYSLDTFNWDVASKQLLKLTTGDTTEDSTVSDAVKDFTTDRERLGNKPQTNQKYTEVLNQLLRFCEGRSITTVRALDLQTLKAFIDTLDDSPRTVGKKIERLRTFIRHCEELEWCDSNPARKIKKPKVTTPPVIPFTAEQQQAIIVALDEYPTKNSFGYDNRARMRAFVLVLRYTALRMSDVVQLRRDKITKGRLLLRTTKTGSPVHLPLPPVLLDALKKIESDSPYYFWSGEGKVKSLISTWQIAFAKLLELAGVGGHPHMYRHTMAIELLELGTTVERVAAILGNSPAIVYKHYSPWVESRQQGIDEAVKQMWGASK
jgi:integrase